MEENEILNEEQILGITDEELQEIEEIEIEKEGE